MGRSLVVTAIGDGNVGKTCMLVRFVEKKFSDDTLPTILDEYETRVDYKGETFELTLNDTAGQEDFEQIRVLQYSKTDVFLVCFALDNKDSFRNVEEKWTPDLAHSASDKPIILVGTKADLSKRVSDDDIEKTRKRIHAFTYVPCSAKNAVNVDNVFSSAINAYVIKEKKKCVIS